MSSYTHPDQIFKAEPTQGVQCPMCGYFWIADLSETWEDDKGNRWVECACYHEFKVEE